MRRDVYQAIADPNRRAIIHLLSYKELTLNGIAEHFEISRPAISKHIKILNECGLVLIHQEGRERVCKPDLQKLREVSDWIDQYKIFWNAKLDKLDQFLSKDIKPKRKNKNQK